MEAAAPQIRQWSAFAVGLFGKPMEAVACRDVLDVAHESPLVELKGRFNNKGELREVILKSVVAFLNAKEGKGLLVLGVRGKEGAGEVQCLPKGLVKEGLESRDDVEGFIRNTVFSYLRSIPRVAAPPYLAVRVFDCRSDCGADRDGWLVAVYVERLADALYYSGIDDGVYVREGSSSRRLKLEEVLQLVESKKKPMVVVLLRPQLVSTQELELEVAFTNIGSKLAKYVGCQLYIAKSVGTPLQPIRVKQIVAHEVLLEDKDMAVLSIALSPPYHMPLFPGVLGTSAKGKTRLYLEGSLNREVQITLWFKATIFTDETKTEQVCTVTSRGGAAENLCELNVVDYSGNLLCSMTLIRSLH